MPTKQIVCFANSDKHNDRCVAGREWVDEKSGDWVRPISARDSHSVSYQEQKYDDGTRPKLLDIVRVPLSKGKSTSFQTENWLLDPSKPWKKVGTISWMKAKSLSDSAGALWPIESDSTKARNDCVTAEQATTFDHSLRLICVNDLVLIVDSYFEKKKYKAQFSFAGLPYHLSVTDPEVKARYTTIGEVHKLGKSVLCVSLSEPFNGACYKLVAGIMLPDGLPPRTK